MVTDEVGVWGPGTMCCYCCSVCVQYVCAYSVLCWCICACMHIRVCACTATVYVLVCLCIHVCVCVGEVVVVVGSSGASSVSVPSATPLCWHPRDWQKGWGIHFGKKESGSSGLMGNNVGFTDGKMQRTPAGRVEANLPISLTKQLATPVKIRLSLPNKAHTPLKWCLKWGRGAQTFTHTQTLHTPGANVSLMHGHAVARGLIGYINTNTSLERQEGKGAFCAICSLYC